MTCLQNCVNVRRCLQNSAATGRRQACPERGECSAIQRNDQFSLYIDRRRPSNESIYRYASSFPYLTEDLIEQFQVMDLSEKEIKDAVCGERSEGDST